MAEAVSDAQATDEAILAQVEQIRNEIAETQSLVGKVEDLSVLSRDYVETDKIYQEKIQYLCTKYASIRRTRPDGNCFFRGFAFAYLERLINDRSDYEKFCALAKESKDRLVSLGFPAFTTEDFHEVFMEMVESVGKPCTVAHLLQQLNEQSLSDYVIVYLRLLTSARLLENAVFFENFIEDGLTVPEFCHREVEPMAKESDHIHVIALSEFLGVCIRVVYMDRGEGGTVNHHDFPEDGGPPHVTLLYRPGHYDILYS